MSSVEVKLRVTATFGARATTEAAMESLFDRITEVLLADEACEDPAVGGSLVGDQFDVEFVTLGGRVTSATEENLRDATDRALHHAKRVIDAIVKLGQDSDPEAEMPAVDWLSLEAQNIREPVPA